MKRKKSSLSPLQKKAVIRNFNKGQIMAQQSTVKYILTKGNVNLEESLQLEEVYKILTNIINKWKPIN